jgi:5'-3' exonuclease
VTKSQLVLLAAIAGCDNMRGIRGVGIEIGLRIVRKIKPGHSTDDIQRIIIKESRHSSVEDVRLALEDWRVFSKGLVSFLSKSI